MRPFPAVPGFGVDNAAVWEVEEEFAGWVGDIGEVCDKCLDCGMDLGGGGFWLWHIALTDFLNRNTIEVVC